MSRTPRGGITGVIVVALSLTAHSLPATAQEARVDSLQARIEELEARIDSLLAALSQSQQDTSSELAALRAAARQAAGAAQRPDTVDQGSRTRNLQILNPEISVTGDVVGNFIAPAGEDNNVSATPREFEFSFQSALDPYSRTKIFITREEEFEIAGFPLEEEGEEGEEGGGFAIEEGYIYWVGLPLGFGAKLGHFRQEIGLYNRWHTHALFEVDRPLASLAFLGESLVQTGGAVTLPSFTLGPATQTLTVELTRGSNDLLFEGGNDISYLAHFQNFWDLSTASYLQFGATGVYGKNDDESLDTRLLAFDLSYRWTPPGRALYRDLNLKAEWYLAEKDFAGADLSGSGGYFQANYRLSRRWIAGARLDYLDGFGSGPEVLQMVPSITWWQSEWVRLRLQYNYLKPEGGDANHTVLLQTVWAVGPHKHETY